MLAVAAGIGIGLVRGEVANDTASSTAETFADNLATLCEQDPASAEAAGTDCPRAVQVALDGVDGLPGRDGRGVVSTSLSGGRLLITYSDGTNTDLGPVGPGIPGPDGTPGRGVAGTQLLGGRLVVLFTDGTRADHGPVVGPAGVGIADVATVEGRLQVTLTDGTLIDAGPLPIGPPGPTGATGAAGVDGQDGTDGAVTPPLARQVFAFPDGTTRACDRTGGPDTAPEFRCGERVEPSPATTGQTPAPEGG